MNQIRSIILLKTLALSRKWSMSNNNKATTSHTILYVYVLTTTKNMTLKKHKKTLKKF